MQRERVGTAKNEFVAVLNRKHNADTLFFRQSSRLAVAILADIERPADSFTTSFCRRVIPMTLNPHLNPSDPRTFFEMGTGLYVIDATLVAPFRAVLRTCMRISAPNTCLMFLGSVLKARELGARPPS